MRPQTLGDRNTRQRNDGSTAAAQGQGSQGRTRLADSTRARRPGVESGRLSSALACSPSATDPAPETRTAIRRAARSAAAASRIIGKWDRQRRHRRDARPDVQGAQRPDSGQAALDDRCGVRERAGACDMTEPVGLSQPTVSHDLKLLVDAGLVTREQRDKWATAKFVPQVLDSLAFALKPARTDGSSPLHGALTAEPTDSSSPLATTQPTSTSGSSAKRSGASTFRRASPGFARLRRTSQ